MLVSLSSVEILIVGLNWSNICGILFEILVVIQSICDFVVKTLTDFLSANIVNEFGCGLDTDLGLNLANESVSIDFALVEALECII